MRAFAALLYVVLVLSGTLICAAQAISTKDAIQDLQISQNTASVDSNSRRISDLQASLSDLRSSVDTSRSWVIGFGCALSALHFIQLITARKKNGNGSTS